MKTIKNNIDEVRRVKDKEADGMVRSGSWKFCPKSEWKATIPNRVKGPKGLDKNREAKKAEKAKE